MNDQVFTLIPLANTSSHTQEESTARKNTLVIALEANQTIDIQIQFKPEKIGIYHNLILIRNNFTIMDAYLVKGKGGSAQLKVENMLPMKSSLFLNEISNRDLKHVTADYSPLEFQMSENDLTLCGDETQYRGLSLKKLITNTFSLFSSKKEPIKKTQFLGKTKRGSTLVVTSEFLNATIEPNSYGMIIGDYLTAYEIEEGIILRELFELKNIGDAKLIVYTVLFDGEPCSSHGFNAAYCKQFSINYNRQNIAYLDIRYQPDFTMSFIRKVLTLVTNIGSFSTILII